MERYKRIAGIEKWDTMKGDIMQILIVLSLFLMIILAPFQTMNNVQTDIEKSSIIGSKTDKDSDGDMILDSDDLIDNGNAILIISIDYLWLDGEADFWSAGDPYFIVQVDMDNDGYYDGSDNWTSAFFEDTDEVDDQGYNVSGEWWFEFDILDNRSWVYYRIICVDDDNGDYEYVDIHPSEDDFYLEGWLYLGQGGFTEYNTTDGTEDSNSDEIDGYVEYWFRLQKGTSIEKATPSSFDITMKEGESLLFSIDEVYTYVSGPSLEYAWFITYPEIDEWLHIDDENNEANDTYELIANFGSEGFYLVAGLVYQESTRYDYIYHDVNFWFLYIEHNNTKPQAVISIDWTQYQHSSSDLYQFDEIHFSGRNSFDIDGDELTYTWDFGDGKTSNEVDTTHTYTLPGDYHVKLTVEDDEGSTDSKIMPITVLPIDLTLADEWGSLSDGDQFTLNTNYTTYSTDSISNSIVIPLLFGYSLSLRAAFVSEMLIEHAGNATYQFDIEETKRDVDYNIDLKTKVDSYEVYYRPYLEFNVSLFDGDGSEYELWSVATPIPLINTNDGLDSDGDPLASIPVFGVGTVDIFTWDLWKQIYTSNGTLNNHTGILDLNTIPVRIAQVDILQFLEAWAGSMPVAGIAINILDYFTNMYIVSDLMVEMSLNDRLGFLIQSTGETDAIDDFIWSDSVDEDSQVSVTGSIQDSKLYGIMKTESEADLSLGVYFHFNLTTEGQTIYGVWSNLEENGLIVGILDTLFEVFTTGSLPSKDYSFRKALWESGNLQSMEDSMIYYWDYLSYSYEYVNTAPSVNLIALPKAKFQINESIKLTWSGSDSDGDNLTYKIYIDQNPNPTTIYSTDLTGDSLEISGLSEGTYYVKIIVHDGELQTASEVISFQISAKDNSKDSSSSSTPDFTIVTIVSAILIVSIVRRRRK